MFIQSKQIVRGHTIELRQTDNSTMADVLRPMRWDMILSGSTEGRYDNHFQYIRLYPGQPHEQNEDLQFIALREMTVPEQNVFIDKQSGMDFNCPQYKSWFPGSFTITTIVFTIGLCYNSINSTKIQNPVKYTMMDKTQEESE